MFNSKKRAYLWLTIIASSIYIPILVCVGVRHTHGEIFGGGVQIGLLVGLLICYILFNRYLSADAPNDAPSGKRKRFEPPQF